VEKGKGQVPSQWQVIGEVPEAGAKWLPTVEAIQQGSHDVHKPYN
jgi:hypothetical protein